MAMYQRQIDPVVMQMLQQKMGQMGQGAMGRPTLGNGVAPPQGGGPQIAQPMNPGLLKQPGGDMMGAGNNMMNMAMMAQKLREQQGRPQLPGGPNAALPPGAPDSTYNTLGASGGMPMAGMPETRTPPGGFPPSPGPQIAMPPGVGQPPMTPTPQGMDTGFDLGGYSGLRNMFAKNPLIDQFPQFPWMPQP